MNVDVLARDVAAALANQGIEVAYQSSYLRQRNWLQIALMGEVDAAALRQLPGALASFSTGVRRVASTSAKAIRGLSPSAIPRAAVRSSDGRPGHPGR
jgi:hypothetical protein